MQGSLKETLTEISHLKNELVHHFLLRDL